MTFTVNQPTSLTATQVDVKCVVQVYVDDRNVTGTASVYGIIGIDAENLFIAVIHDSYNLLFQTGVDINV